MLLPGSEAQQLATYIGWLMHRTWGGVIAGLLFILAGGRLVESTHGNLKFTAPLSVITAAACGPDGFVYQVLAGLARNFFCSIEQI